MHPSAQRVQNVLKELGYTGQVVEHEASTRTAVEAAQAAGCEVGQIVKSLVFRLEPTGEPVLVLVSGPNRVHEKHFGRLLGGTLERADADYVHDICGYAIGGVPPVGHKARLKTYVDEDLLQYEVVWAAAGTPNAVFPVTPQELVRMCGGQVVSVK
jgi:prolyl-tRNA editing enzyme YbaK/EbsC (Cys-tRNA(Pro) deacylase)